MVADALLDTSVLVDLLRGFQPARVWFAGLGRLRMAITPVVWMETVSGATDRHKTRSDDPLSAPVSPGAPHGRRQPVGDAPVGPLSPEPRSSASRCDDRVGGRPTRRPHCTQPTSSTFCRFRRWTPENLTEVPCPRSPTPLNPAPASSSTPRRTPRSNPESSPPYPPAQTGCCGGWARLWVRPWGFAGWCRSPA